MIYRVRCDRRPWRGTLTSSSSFDRCETANVVVTLESRLRRDGGQNTSGHDSTLEVTATGRVTRFVTSYRPIGCRRTRAPVSAGDAFATVSITTRSSTDVPQSIVVDVGFVRSSGLTLQGGSDRYRLLAEHVQRRRRGPVNGPSVDSLPRVTVSCFTYSPAAGGRSDCAQSRSRFECHRFAAVVDGAAIFRGNSGGRPAYSTNGASP